MCKLFRILALIVWNLWLFEDLEEKDESISELINDGGVCRTAPATPGLLTIEKHKRAKVWGEGQR